MQYLWLSGGHINQCRGSKFGIKPQRAQFVGEIEAAIASPFGGPDISDNRYSLAWFL